MTKIGSPPKAKLESVTAAYAARRPASKELYGRLTRLLPGGETRSITFYRPFPTAIREGHGGYLIDVDGHRYIDVLNNYTALVHGHGFAPVVRAIQRVTEGGTVYPAPTAALAELAERLVTRFPAAELVRFTNSGTEAAILALRIARRVTGRRKVLLFRGGYHGTAPPFADADPEAVLVRYNELAAVEAALGPEIAAVFAEPFLGSGGVVPAEPGFLDAVRAAARRVGAIFVLDEVQAARNVYGGEHASLGEPPDLILLGKLIGGGLPVGAVAGRRDLMQSTAAYDGGLAHSGTFNGNVAMLAAGIAALDALDENTIAVLNERARMLGLAIQAAAAAAGVDVAVTRSGSIMHVHLLREVPVNAEEAASASTEDAAMMHLMLLDEGIYTAPRGMLNLSTALTEDDIAEVADAYVRVFAAMATQA